MKPKYWFWALGVLLMAGVAGAATVKIITQQGTIRKDNRFFAPVVTNVPYGESVEVLETRGDWLRVSYQNKKGWIHVREVQKKKFSLAALSTVRAEETAQDEVALAGKGFSPEVEKAFQDKNPKMDFRLVDKVESIKVSDKQIQAFIRNGKLREPGGES
jgi:hypothetical protein